MDNETIYTWTFATIAMIGGDEDKEDTLLQWAAYNEFENAIAAVEQPSKDINFVIYLYDFAYKKCYIKQAHMVNGRYCLYVVESYSLTDFYGNDYQHLILFFNNHVAVKKPLLENEVHTHFLTVWGHAAGIGYFSNGINTNTSLPFLQPGGYINNQKNAAQSQDYNTIKCITADGLKTIIAKGLKDDYSFMHKDGKIDYLLCVSCFTQMIETGDILSKVVKVMIAPVTTISFFGYNYKALFKVITEQPGADAVLVSNQLVDTYLAKYAEPDMLKHIRDESIYSIEYRKQVAFSAIRLQQYGAVKQGIKSFVDFVIKDGNTISLFDKFNISVKQGVKYARRKCLETTFPQIAGTGIIDFNNFIMQFFGLYASEFITGGYVKNLFNAVYGTYYKGLIIAQYHPGYYNYFDDIIERQLMSQSAGSFGIFFPRAFPVLTKKEQQIFNTLGTQSQYFWAETNWLRLVELVGVGN